MEKKILGIFRINPVSINPSRTTPLRPSNPFEVEEDRPGDFSSSRRMWLDEPSNPLDEGIDQNYQTVRRLPFSLVPGTLMLPRVIGKEE